MAKLKSKKFAAAPKWKPVEITGNLLNPTEDFEGFIGLEVLENYDDSFLRGNKKQKVRTNFLLESLKQHATSCRIFR